MAKDYEWDIDNPDNDWNVKPKQTAPKIVNSGKDRRKCKACGTIYYRHQKRCPTCGKKRPFGESPILWVILTLIWVCMFIDRFIGCGSSPSTAETPKHVNEKQDAALSFVRENASKGSKNKSSKRDVFYIDETAEMNNVQVTLTGYRESQGDSITRPEDGNIFLYADFDIANNQSNEITISSVLSFDLYADDYIMDFSSKALMCSDLGKPIDGTIEPGKKLKGAIGYEVPADWKTVEIHFKDDIWENNKFKFLIKR